jgi:hypothetical protein
MTKNWHAKFGLTKGNFLTQWVKKGVATIGNSWLVFNKKLINVKVVFKSVICQIDWNT